MRTHDRHRRASRPRPRRWLAAAVAVLTGLGVTGTGGSPAAAHDSPGTVVIEGRGWGHGRGMGQWGALGYAVDHGWSYRRILDHFYGGTTAGTLAEAADRRIRVRLMARDGTADLLVRSGRPWTVETSTGTTVDRPGGTAARFSRDGSTGVLRVYTGPGCAGPWTEVPGVAIPPGDGDPWIRAVPGTDRPGADTAAMIAVCAPEGDTYYRGAIELRSTSWGTRVINDVLLEEYLKGVVPRESPASWGAQGGGAGLEALKAQAVTARSYAAGEARYPYAQTCDTTACQVYGGAAFRKAGATSVTPRDHGPTYAATERAVTETTGEVRVPAGTASAASVSPTAVVRTEFASSTGGWTARADTERSGFPDVPDEGDDISGNPWHTWTVEIPRSRIEALWPSVGSLRAIEITRRNGRGAWGGRVKEVVLRGSAGTVRLPCETYDRCEFRSRLGLRSDWFRIAGGLFPDDVSGAAFSAAGGYWLTDVTGRVYNFSGAPHRGSMEGQRLNQPVVDMAAPADGRGYWLLGRDGGVFSFGVPFWGSTGGMRLNAPVVGMAAHPSGDGYWFVASDGGIFAFGPRARFHGSMGGRPLFRPVVGMAAHPSGDGYWLVASDGGIFAFGAARFFGSTGGRELVSPIVGMAPHPSGDGYWFVAADGGVFAFGAAKFWGSLGDTDVGAPVTDLVPTPSGEGYLLITADGRVFGFGDAA